MKTLLLFTILSLAMLNPLPADANLISGENKGPQIESVSTSLQARLEVGSQKTELSLAGAGLRKKKVAFIPVKVYVTELFVQNPSAWKKDIPTLVAQGVWALRLTFLRDVDGDKVMGSFQEALQANKISLDQEDLKSFLKVVENGGEAKKNSALVISGSGSDLHVSTPDGRTTTLKSSPEFSSQILSIWFGKAADSGLEDLKSALLKGL